MSESLHRAESHVGATREALAQSHHGESSESEGGSGSSDGDESRPLIPGDLREGREKQVAPLGCKAAYKEEELGGCTSDGDPVGHTDGGGTPRGSDAWGECSMWGGSAKAGGGSSLAKWSGMWNEKVRSNMYVAFVIVFFAGSSLCAIFINKRCLTGYNFNYPFTLMTGQMGFAVVVISLMHVAGYLVIPAISAADCATLVGPSFLFTGNVVVGLSALSMVNIPMFSALRRLTLLFVMGAEFAFLRKRYSRGIVNSVVIMAFGAFISAVDDVSFSRLGYFLVFLNNVLTALYLASIKKVMRETQFSPLSLLFYTGCMGFPVVVLAALATGEMSHALSALRAEPELQTASFMWTLALTAAGAFFVNFSTTLCTDVTSPLTTSVAGQVKNILQTVLGFFSWGFVPTFVNLFGLLMALGAQLAFGYFKYVESEHDPARSPPGGAAAAGHAADAKLNLPAVALPIASDGDSSDAADE